MYSFFSVFGIAAIFSVAKDIYVGTINPKENKVKGENRNPYNVGQMTAKDVKFREIMTLEANVFWSNDNSEGFPGYHLAVNGYEAGKICVELEDKIVRCDVEEKRVFRWLPGFDLSPSVQCAAQQQCYVPFPIFKTNHRVINHQDIVRFPIDEHILNLPQPTLRALKGPGLAFNGPAKKSIWSKVLYLYVQGYFTTTRASGETKLTPYNHTVAIDLGEGLLDTIFGLTSSEVEFRSDDRVYINPSPKFSRHMNNKTNLF
ncbi:hypothetical protein DSO57_1000131 [Entomophthora muscae]|uniref:Uncharacterized protein n=1 Tax=Entomophthora muscae TaxID=34485 RepID=A0ACC2SMF3_9FUNG|nr:hypothetical protein DSO57_1000131 [Entomophthora muscae]